MPLDNSSLDKLLELAKEAALSASKIISHHQDSINKVHYKKAGVSLASQVVTEVDLKAQRAILEVLTPTLKRYGLGLLTEETADDNSRFCQDYFWCIDPLDGTMAFSQNQEGYSTSIALVARDGTPIIGVVSNPRDNSLYYALKGRGVFKNASPFNLDPQSRIITLLHDQSYFGRPYFQEHINELEKRAKAKGFEGLILKSLGGAVMQALSTIEMAPAIYYKLPKVELGGGNAWDFAATSLIQAMAGGFNSDYHAKPLELNKEGPTFMNQRGVIYLSNPSMLEFLPKRE